MEAIEALQKGRYGLMDGRATARAAGIISKIKGKFVFQWPKSTRDYSQLRIRQNEAAILTRMNCGICKEPFVIMNESYLRQFANRFGGTLASNINELKVQGKTAEEILAELEGILIKTTEQAMTFEHSTACPHCSARFFFKNQ